MVSGESFLAFSQMRFEELSTRRATRIRRCRTMSEIQAIATYGKQLTAAIDKLTGVLDAAAANSTAVSKELVRLNKKLVVLTWAIALLTLILLGVGIIQLFK